MTVTEPTCEWAVMRCGELGCCWTVMLALPTWLLASTAVLRALAARLREAGDTDAAVQYTLRLLRQDRYDEETRTMSAG